jgi:CBS domain containing-hemolysin-like protein
LDEYSGTQGLLTLEDISKEIFHVISPEREVDLKILSRLKNDCSEIILSGNTRLDDINEMLETHFHCKNGETLAGFLLENFDSMGKKSMTLKTPDWIFTVKSATATRILKVGIKKNDD